MQAAGGPLAVTLVWTDHPGLPLGGFAKLRRQLPAALLHWTTPNDRAAFNLGTDALLCYTFAAARALVIDLDLAVRPAGLNGTLLLGNFGSVDGGSQPDR